MKGGICPIPIWPAICCCIMAIICIIWPIMFIIIMGLENPPPIIGLYIPS